jgi:two-component system chemotaxis sensor kinase CheA
MTPLPAVPAASPAGTPAANAALAPHLQAVLETQAAILALPDGDPWLGGRLRAVAATLGACFAPRHGPAIAAALDAALEQASGAPLRDWLQARMASPGGAAGDGGEPGAPARRGEDDNRFGRRADDVQIGKVLKVDQAKVERMMDLIGEMVVAKNSLPYLASRAENQYGVRDLARDIKAQYAVINRIAEEMQDAIMQVRMMPMSVVLQRFPRLVRDISRRLGKEVDLVLEGEDTEADKHIVEVLADPLMHIVRNSLDHGFETPEQRLAAGKPRAGRLTIRATQESDRVRIEVADDGRGIDPQQVRRKAVAKGIIDQAQAERLSDAQATELVFAPGFSTAESVTDLSGRGVGMDVVRTALANAGGTLELHSVPGAGTTLRLSLPLSVAVTNVMVVESDGQIFGVPMDLVVESVRLPMAAVRTIKHSMTTVLRGAIVPLVALNALLALPAEPVPNSDNELATLVVRAGSERVGLLVDHFRGVIDVLLKPLPGELGKLDCYAGSALLGDGSVLMVLNPKELLQ